MLALRLPFAATFGALVTLVVFSVLWGLVSVPIDVAPLLPTARIDFTQQRKETPTETKRKEKTQRPPPQQTPDPPRTTGTKVIEPPTRFQRASFDPGVRLPRQGGLPMRPDGDVVPIVRIGPEYPASAITKGIEGWVQVRFTVTTIGTVKDAIVVDAEPKHLFDDAALKSIARWRYNPKVESGVPIERVGLQTVIRFQLDNN